MLLAIVRKDDELNHLERFHWGLVPFWSKDPGIGSRMINARSESVASKPSFRTAFRIKPRAPTADIYVRHFRTMQQMVLRPETLNFHYILDH